jgi:hypothetical protein
MTVNEMIAELERERDNGHGEKRVLVYHVDFTGGERNEYVTNVRSILHRPLKPYARDFVEII